MLLAKYVRFVMPAPIFFSLMVFPQPSLANLKATVTIRSATDLGEVNRYILGNNLIGAHSRFEGDFFSDYAGGIWEPGKKVYAKTYLNVIRNAGVSVLRWPGGGWPAGLNWKKAIGPASGRPGQLFGVPEFLGLCKRIGAIPLVVLPTQGFTQADYKEFAEYLDAADVRSGRSTGANWAASRVADGRVKPWGVVWFELGNETYTSRMSAERYAALYLKVQSAMKQVDPDIKLGAVLDAYTSFDSGWNATVLTRIGRVMDFATIHPYLTPINQQAASAFGEKTLAKIAVSSGADLAFRLSHLNETIRKITGRSNIPLAATEYNGLFLQDKPVPFRFTLANAIRNADYVRIMLQPRYHVIMANYWALLDSYWGMIQKGITKGSIVKEPNYFVYELYHKYLGNHLYRMSIEAPSFPFSGALGIGPRIGKPRTGGWIPYAGHIPAKWTTRWLSDVGQAQNNGVLELTFHGDRDMNYGANSVEVPVQPDTLYRVSVKARTIDLRKGKIGIAVEDARGWSNTFYQPANVLLSGTTPWTTLTVEFRTLANAKKMRILVRRFNGGGRIRGRAEFGDPRIEQSQNRLGAVQSVSGVASSSDNRRELYVVLINKNLHDAVDTSIKVDKNYRVSNSEVLTGPSPYSTNLDPKRPDLVGISGIRVRKLGSQTFVVRLPAVSVTGIKFSRNTPTPRAQ